MKLVSRDRPGDILMYCLHRLQVINPAHKLLAIDGGDPKFSLRYGQCVQTAA